MTDLSKKLQLKSEQGLKLVNSPDGHAILFAGAGVNIIESGDALLVFVNSLAEVEQIIPGILKSILADTLLWVAYPKGSSGVKTDLNRDKLWEALKPTGWRPVRQIALDEVWSALRFRPADLVGK